MPVFETSDVSCQKNLTEFQVQVSENRLFQDPMKSYENPMVYGNVQPFPYEIAILGDQSPWAPRFWISTPRSPWYGAPAPAKALWGEAPAAGNAQLETNGYHGFYRSKRNDHLGLSQEK